MVDAPHLSASIVRVLETSITRMACLVVYLRTETAQTFVTQPGYLPGISAV